MTTVKHRHLQLNVKQTMSPAKIRADVVKAFSFTPDTIVFNEAVTVTHRAIREQARAHGYGYLILPGSQGQVVLCWNKAILVLEFAKATFAMRGREHVTPTRWVIRARLRVRATGRRRGLVGTHTVASGWTGSKYLDAWRQKGWYLHVAVLTLLLLAFARNKAIDMVVWSGDMNRPPYSFKGGRPFPQLVSVPGFATSIVVHTDATHGRIIFDYVGVLSRKFKVRVARWSTPTFSSDHDGILTDLEWDAAA